MRLLFSYLRSSKICISHKKYVFLTHLHIYIKNNKETKLIAYTKGESIFLDDDKSLHISSVLSYILLSRLKLQKSNIRILSLLA